MQSIKRAVRRKQAVVVRDLTADTPGKYRIKKVPSKNKRKFFKYVINRDLLPR